MVITTDNDRFLPGDSLPSLAISIAQGAENVHLNLVMSADEQIMVLRDIILNDLTNAAELFPDKARTDGMFLVMDFTASELKQLSLTGPPEPQALSNELQASPLPLITMATLDEALGIIRIMEKNRGSRIEIVAEIKKSWHYLHENRDISRVVLDVLRQHGYTGKDSGLTIASYDPEELQRIDKILLPEAGLDLNILQLTEDNAGQQTKRFELGRWQYYNYDWLYTKFGLKAVSAYADMISLAPEFLVNESGDLLHQEYVEDAHILGLKIIVHSIDRRIDPSIEPTSQFDSFLDLLLFTAGADGLITNHDQRTREFLARKSQNNGSGNKTTIEILLENVRNQQIN